MRIITYGINFYPELTGIGKYTGEMCFELAKDHQLTMITAYPYYPQWRVQEGYSNGWWKHESVHNVQVIRCPFYVPKTRSSARRILHEISFLLSSSISLVRQLFSKIDIVICIVTPFHLGIPARLFSWLKGVPMVYHIQDLQVDAARELDMIKSRQLISTLINLEKWILDKSDLVTTISTGMVKKILDKGIAQNKVVLFPNWVESAVIYPLSKEQSLKKSFGFLDSDKIVLYAGNLGEKQGLEQIITLAEEFSTFPNLHFVIVGEGGLKDKLVETAIIKSLKNVHFFPLQPYSKLSALLAMADTHLILQKKSAADLVMPSKLTSVLSAGGCPIVTASKNTALFDVINEFKMGILVEPEDMQSLKEAIVFAATHDLSIYQYNARKYAERYIDKQFILSEFKKRIEDLAPIKDYKKR